jgi:hypothetical protein
MIENINFLQFRQLGNCCSNFGFVNLELERTFLPQYNIFVILKLAESQSDDFATLINLMLVPPN